MKDEKKHSLKVHKSAKVVDFTGGTGRAPRCDICNIKTPNGRERVLTLDGPMDVCARCAGNLR